MSAEILLAASSPLLVYGTVAMIGRRRGSSWRTPGQLVVRALYRWARLWSSMAIAADKAVLHFHLSQQQAPIEPESEFARAR